METKAKAGGGLKLRIIDWRLAIKGVRD